MNLNLLFKELVMDSGVLGLLTVGLVYALTHSGPFIIGLAILGVVLVALGGGAAGQAPAGGMEDANGSGLDMMDGNMDVWPGPSWPGTSPDIPVRVRILFYGIGLVGWSVAALGLFTSSLH